jgi:hypothetical protein
MPLKPVEHRTLRAPTSSAPQGKLKLWVDIFSAEDAKKYPLVNIQPPPPVEYELRVIIWGAFFFFFFFQVILLLLRTHTSHHASACMGHAKFL